MDPHSIFLMLQGDSGGPLMVQNSEGNLEGNILQVVSMNVGRKPSFQNRLTY